MTDLDKPVMTAFIVDDEPLAVQRLHRLLSDSGRVTLLGTASDPFQAPAQIAALRPNVLFLDIEMPGLSGFDLLERLAGLDPAVEPLVVFTTAYNQYALDAFKVNSIDYLLKPVNSSELERALLKLERVMTGPGPKTSTNELLQQMRQILAKHEERQEPPHLARIPSRAGGKVIFVNTADVTHFYAEEKVTFAVTASPVKHYPLDFSIAELEKKLPPQRWIRIHRSTLLNIDAVKELHGWFGGGLMVRLHDGTTELKVARDRAAEVKARLGL